MNVNLFSLRGISTASIFMITVWVFTISKVHADPSDPRIVGVSVKSDVKTKLKNIARVSGDTAITVTSVNRSSSDQIRISIQAYGGVEKAKTQYASPCNSAFFGNDQTKMAEKLKEILSANPRPKCMRHVESDGTVVDIDPNSVTNKKKFYDAVKASGDVDLNRFYYPDIDGVPKSPVKDRAFHIEFK